MAMVANDPAKAKQLGIPQSVGAEFVKADKGRKFGSGSRSDLAGINKSKTDHGKMSLFKAGGKMKHDDLAEDKKLIKKAFGMHDKQLHEKKKTDLTKLKGGGMARMTSKGEHPVQKQSKRGAMEVKMAKGGLAAGHKSADGCATKGKTKARAVTMCGGGMAKKTGRGR
jgi:hypothetical protein